MHPPPNTRIEIIIIQSIQVLVLKPCKNPPTTDELITHASALITNFASFFKFLFSFLNN